MAFPITPNIGEQYPVVSPLWIWDGVTWNRLQPSTGSFVPNGGTTNQVLVKNSNVDGDTKWVTGGGGGGGGLSVSTYSESVSTALNSDTTITIATVSTPVLLLGLSVTFVTPGILGLSVKIGGVEFVKLESIENNFDSNVSYFMNGTGSFVVTCTNGSLVSGVDYTVAVTWSPL